VVQSATATATATRLARAIDRRLLRRPISSPLLRYEQLVDHLERVPTRAIVEVGTWNGRRAQEMALAALSSSREVHYVGFDLFEALTDEDLEAELSKRPPSRGDVARDLRTLSRRLRLQSALPTAQAKRFTFELVAGYTRDSMPRFRCAHPDFRTTFAFIDGGHRVETIANDWEHCSAMLADEGTVFFDDFYEEGSKLTTSFGCNQLMAALAAGREWNVEVLPVGDQAPDIGSIRIAQVTRR